MKTLLLAVIVLTLVVPLSNRTAFGSSPKKVVAVSYAPVLNTPDFAGSFSGKVQLDPCRGVRPIEFVALPGTLFTVEKELEQNGVKVLRVTSDDYPYASKTGLFIDARFVEAAGPAAQERRPHLPELAEIQKRLLAALGEPYVWGGNVRDGVPLLRKYHPHGDPLAGVDCSGLLYQATDGFTPRNTSTLIGYGEAVPVAGLSAEAIAGKLKPLDLLVWNGHVMVVLDNDSIIESRMGCGGKPSGVMITPRLELVRQIMKTRKPADSFPKGSAGAKSFVVRRWFTAGGR